MIKQAIYIKEYKIKIIFDNDIEKIIDLYDFLSKSTHHLIKKYLDINLFKNFRHLSEMPKNA